MAAIVPFFITLNDYVPVFEREICARIREPVSIERLHVAVFPTPHVTIAGLTIGANDDIKVGQVTFTPNQRALPRMQP